jgi:predicted DNA-binding protein
VTAVTEDKIMKTKNYVLRTKNENIEIIRKLAQENLKSMNQYLNGIIENHINEKRKNDIIKN